MLPDKQDIASLAAMPYNLLYTSRCCWVVAYYDLMHFVTVRFDFNSHDAATRVTAPVN